MVNLCLIDVHYTMLLTSRLLLPIVASKTNSTKPMKKTHRNKRCIDGLKLTQETHMFFSGFFEFRFVVLLCKLLLLFSSLIFRFTWFWPRLPDGGIKVTTDHVEDHPIMKCLVF